MLVITDSAVFGVQISPSHTSDPRFFTFQLRIGDVLVGDLEPGIVWSAVNELTHLPELDDPRLHDPVADPQRALDAVLTDELCNRALYQGAESLDRWLVAAYTHDGVVVWLARPNAFSGDHSGSVAVAVVDAAEYDDISAVVTDYYRRASERQRT